MDPLALPSVPTLPEPFLRANCVGYDDAWCHAAKCLRVGYRASRREVSRAATSFLPRDLRVAIVGK